MNTVMKKVIIVTEASADIGKQSVLRFLREGYTLQSS